MKIDLQILLCFFLFNLFLPIQSSPTSIIVTTLGRSSYAFDLFTLPTRHRHHHPPSPSSELRLTDGTSVNFNGHFAAASPAPSLLQPQQQPHLHLVYVTERNGTHSIFYDAVPPPQNGRSRSALEISPRVSVPLLDGQDSAFISMKDKPTVVGGDKLVYVSTHEEADEPRASWAAVYSTDLKTGSTRRLTPYGVADFSPAVSPSGVYTAVASYGGGGWKGEVEELTTDLYVFLTRDGSERVKIVEHGGWPSWVDDSTLFFHRKNQFDDWISVYKASWPIDSPISSDSVVIERVTPPGIHAFTPAAAPGNYDFIAVATRRPTSSFRHIELFDLKRNEFVELTRFVSPSTHHLNPFISPDSEQVGYHRCRKGANGSPHLHLESLRSSKSDVSLFRFDGSYPVFSPAGDRIAYVNMPGMYVVNLDGSNRRKVFPGMAFTTEWDPVRPGIVYTAVGPTFAPISSEVDIISINVDSVDSENSVQKLTTNGINNAFPSVSPDGKWVVFRSGKSGYKNLYIMDAEKGESNGLVRLTDGPWTDTMCKWSPDGDLIAFSSDRHDPGSGSFAIYLIHPNGTGLRKLVESGAGGRCNHPYFSPDGKAIVFTTDYAGISAEPISNPHHYQPYGDIFTINLDGSDLTRLTHNSYEDGTPAWGPAHIEPKDVTWPNYGSACSFEDCYFLDEIPSSGGLVNTTLSGRPQC
ncbi:Tol-Pal system protein TolB [Linum grandiflorum]